MGTPCGAELRFPDDSHVGVTRLLEDMQKLLQDPSLSDIIFIVGVEERRMHVHKIIMKARCRSFAEVSGNDTCLSIPGSIVSPGHPHTTIRLPQTPAKIFHQVICYIYTGKISLNDAGIFEIYDIAQDLGLEELCQHCEDYISKTTTPHNACTLLMTALGRKSNATFVDRIVAFIGENAFECLHSTAFLTLSRDALIRLISSDNLALEEDDVWRGVLGWAKHKAGVTQPTLRWSEEERRRVCQHLQGVINHVRLLLIDSQVFAEEVEPTGAVPMELSLERYRFAALPNKFKESSTDEDKRLQPRVSLKLFSSSQILSDERMSYQRVLNNWYGAPKQMWKMIFRGSTHGFSAEAFHRHCDGVSPTYTVVMGQQGNVCGGFSDVPWGQTTLKGRYVASERAFLFTLINNQGLPPIKYPVVKKMFAICYHPDCGPIFGAGADFFIANNCNKNMDSYSNLPHSYEGENASCNILMGDYNFTVLDYEVFTLYGK